MKKRFLILALFVPFLLNAQDDYSADELPEKSTLEGISTEYFYLLDGSTDKHLTGLGLKNYILVRDTVVLNALADSASDLRSLLGGTSAWYLDGNNVTTNYLVRSKSTYDPGSVYDFAAYIAAFLAIDVTSIGANQLVCYETYNKGDVNFLEGYGSSITWTGSWLGSSYDTIVKIYRLGSELYFYSDDAGTKALTDLGADISAGNLLTKYSVGDNYYMKLGGTSAENTSLSLGNYNMAWLFGSDSLVRVNNHSIKIFKQTITDTLVIGDSTITEIYEGVIPDTTEVIRLIDEYSFDEGNIIVSEDTSNVKLILDADDSLKYSVNVYAEMYNDSASIATTITTQNIWYVVENMTQGTVFENATYTTDTIWIDYDGIYLINPGSWAAYGGFTNEFEMGISINGGLPEIQGRTFVGLQSGYQSHSGSPFIKRLSDNDYIVLKVKNISGTDDITFRYGSVTIMKLN